MEKLLEMFFYVLFFMFGFQLMYFLHELSHYVTAKFLKFSSVCFTFITNYKGLKDLFLKIYYCEYYVDYICSSSDKHKLTNVFYAPYLKSVIMLMIYAWLSFLYKPFIMLCLFEIIDGGNWVLGRIFRNWASKLNDGNQYRIYKEHYK